MAAPAPRPGLAPARLSVTGLARLHDLMAAHVEAGAMPGLVTLVATGADVHVDAIGTKAFDDPTPMTADAIFRIASLSKPVVAAAAMVLVDDGVLRLGDPIDALLPELARPRVLRALDAEVDDTVAAVRAITVEDLLTYRMGFGTVMAPPDTYPIQTAEAPLELRTLGPPWPPDAAHARRVDRPARVPAPPLPAGPGVVVQHERHGPGRAGGAGVGAAARGVPAPAAVRAPRHGRHRLPRAARPDGPVHHRLLARSRDGRAARCSTAPTPPASGRSRRTCRTGRVAGVHRRRLLGLRRHAPARRDARGRAHPAGLVGGPDDRRPPDRLPAGVGAPVRRRRRLGLRDGRAGRRRGRGRRPEPNGFGWDGGTGTTWRSDPPAA